MSRIKGKDTKPEMMVRIVIIVSLLLKADSPSKETNFNCPSSDFSKSNGIAKSSAKSKLSQSQEMPVENGLLVFRSKQKDSFLSQQVKPLELTLNWKNSPRSQKASQFKIRDFSEQTKKIWQRHNERKIESERHGFTKESKIAAMIFVIRYRLT